MVCDVNDAMGFQCNAVRFVCYAMRDLNEGLNDIVCYGMVWYGMVWYGMVDMVWDLNKNASKNKWVPNISK